MVSLLPPFFPVTFQMHISFPTISIQSSFSLPIPPSSLSAITLLVHYIGGCYHSGLWAIDPFFQMSVPILMLPTSHPHLIALLILLQQHLKLSHFFHLLLLFPLFSWIFSCYFLLHSFIESSITSFVDFSLARSVSLSLDTCHQPLPPLPLFDTIPPPSYPYTKAASSYSATVQLYA